MRKNEFRSTDGESLIRIVSINVNSVFVTKLGSQPKTLLFSLDTVFDVIQRLRSNGKTASATENERQSTLSISKTSVNYYKFVAVNCNGEKIEVVLHPDKYKAFEELLAREMSR